MSHREEGAIAEVSSADRRIVYDPRFIKRFNAPPSIPLRSLVRVTNAHDFRGKVNAKSGDRDDGRSGWWSVDDVDRVKPSARGFVGCSLSLSYYVLLIEPVVVARWLEFRDIVVCFAKLRNYGSIESDNYGQILDNENFTRFPNAFRSINLLLYDSDFVSTRNKLLSE